MGEFADVPRFCCWEGQRWDSKQAVELRVSALSLVLSLRRVAIEPSALHIWKIVFPLAKRLRERGSFRSWTLSYLLNFLWRKHFYRIVENYNVTVSAQPGDPIVLWSVVTQSFQFGLIWASMVMLPWVVSTVPSETSVKHRMAEAG